MVLILLAGVAEVFAIRGAVDGSIGGFFLHYVAFVLCGGTLALALNVATPWTRTLLGDRFTRSGRGSGTFIVIVVLTVAVFGFGAQFWVRSGVSQAQFSQTLDGAFTSYVAAEQTRSATFSETVAAREAALTLVAEHASMFTSRERDALTARIKTLVDAVNSFLFPRDALNPVDREQHIIRQTEAMTAATKQELGGATEPAAVLVTMTVDEVKSTAIAYIKIEDASRTALKALEAACHGGQDPRCNKSALKAQAA
ncbi:MAG TPA: hypothetical protein VK272_10345 [Solirubrobacteraceae bacterium]|nr:hypothetical protein [Solirubrobacteraceae bacterium]